MLVLPIRLAIIILSNLKPIHQLNTILTNMNLEKLNSKAVPI